MYLFHKLTLEFHLKQSRSLTIVSMYSYSSKLLNLEFFD
jgi:hypothetical protein